ncbi:hypothetical protein SAMN06297387_12842 [Streptomyces zhaozhouensis]|uniref:Uncharacterized protein n=1 Tax=Streptomyces zhaozhouensis TaxID=1300267 RepID=A0A286E822_9ACTN|nr:hypothetical protein [Streptomyces zhaozhouensis]SOD67040.1 hypothetical protein SAMN06297387_12842 [Streptomyces zhaozhouensis]
MSNSPTTARTRPKRSRTRARTPSARPALALSALPLLHLDLRPGALCLVCPDCGTWCAILGIQRRTPLVTPHDTQKAGTPNRRRCLGSNRALVIDITVAEWARRYQQALEGAVTPAARHATTLIKRAAPAPRGPGQTDLAPAEVARRAHRDHLARCTTCTSTSRCPAGTRLEQEALRLLAAPADRRATEWGRVLPAVRRANNARTTPTR